MVPCRCEWKEGKLTMSVNKTLAWLRKLVVESDSYNAVIWVPSPTLKPWRFH